MEKFSADAIVREQTRRASGGGGRAAATVYGGHEKTLLQTMIALTAGTSLAEHESPGDATVYVLGGRVRLASAAASWEGPSG
jgi:quercetin dioxygenase-like cupin family protein